ncbi:MAG: hypothetical protein ABFD53_06380 [Anaerolineaceae bacterium]
MNRKLVFLVSMLVALSLVFSACAQATPAPTEEAPAVEQPAAEEPAAE